MKKSFRFLCVTLIASIVALLCIPSAHAYNNQQWYDNNMPDTAFDLTKIIEGDLNIERAIKDKFNDYNVTHPQGTHTVIHWFDGFVAPTEGTMACFEAKGVPQRKNYLRFVDR